MKLLLFIFILTCTATASTLPSFPFKNGWMGSDLAYSIQVAENKNIWFFGDTYIGDKGAKNRLGVKRVTSSVGISHINDAGEYKIKYYWRNMGTDHPEAIFPHVKESEGYLYWPKDAILIDKKLYVGLVEILVYDSTSPMGFKEVGTSLAIVDNPQSSPDKWHYVYKNFSSHDQVFPATRFFKRGKYLYWFSTYKLEYAPDELTYMKWLNMPILLQRVHIDYLDNIKDHQEYYSVNDKFVAGFNLQQSQQIIDHGATEMTAHYSEPHKAWVTVYDENAISSDRVLVRFAKCLEGPWSKPVEVFRYPEMNTRSEAYFEGGFGYAPKFHPQYFDATKPYQAVMTYVVNNEQEWRLIDRLDAYVPQVVTVDLPKDIYELFNDSKDLEKHECKVQ